MNDEVKFVLDEYLFTWDDNKASANLRKHKISFEMAAEVFVDDFAVYMFDEYHRGDED